MIPVTTKSRWILRSRDLRAHLAAVRPGVLRMLVVQEAASRELASGWRGSSPLLLLCNSFWFVARLLSHAPLSVDCHCWLTQLRDTGRCLPVLVPPADFANAGLAQLQDLRRCLHRQPRYVRHSFVRGSHQRGPMSCTPTTLSFSRGTPTVPRVPHALQGRPLVLFMLVANVVGQRQLRTRDATDRLVVSTLWQRLLIAWDSAVASLTGLQLLLDVHLVLFSDHLVHLEERPCLGWRTVGGACGRRTRWGPDVLPQPRGRLGLRPVAGALRRLPFVLSSAARRSIIRGRCDS